MRLFYQIPETDLIFDKLSRAEVLLHFLPDVVGFLFHLLDDVLFPGVVLILAAGLQIHLVNHPELQVVTEGQDAHLVYQVEAASSVKV